MMILDVLAFLACMESIMVVPIAREEKLKVCFYSAIVEEEDDED